MGLLARWRKWRAYDVGEAKEGLGMSTFSNLSITSPTTQLILRPFRRITYITAHSPTLPLLHVCQLILQPFFRFSYVTGSSLTLPGELPVLRARLHQKSLGPYEIILMITMVNDILEWMGPKLSRHLSYSWRKSPENLNQENWPDRDRTRAH